MVFENICVLVLRMKVASALEGLKSIFLKYLKENCLILTHPTTLVQIDCEYVPYSEVIFKLNEDPGDSCLEEFRAENGLSFLQSYIENRFAYISANVDKLVNLQVGAEGD